MSPEPAARPRPPGNRVLTTCGNPPNTRLATFVTESCARRRPAARARAGAGAGGAPLWDALAPRDRPLPPQRQHPGAHLPRSGGADDDALNHPAHDGVGHVKLLSCVKLLTCSWPAADCAQAVLPPEPHPRQAQGGPRRRPAPRPLKPTPRCVPRFPSRLQTPETRRPLRSAATVSTQRSSAPAETSAAARVYARPPTPAARRAPRRRDQPARCACRWLVGPASEAPEAAVRALGAEPPPRPRDRARPPSY